jgi:hypothetical protein
LYTLVNDKVGKDTPIKKPKTTPKNVVKSILMVSFGFLLPALQHNICKYFIGKVVIKSKPKKNLSKEETIKRYIYIYIYIYIYEPAEVWTWVQGFPLCLQLQIKLMTRNTNLNVSRERVSAYKEVKGTPNLIWIEQQKRKISLEDFKFVIPK